MLLPHSTQPSDLTGPGTLCALARHASSCTSTIPMEVAPADVPRRVGQTRGAQQHGGRKGRLSEMLASKRDCRREHPADQHSLPSCESPIATESPPQQTHRGGLTRDAQQHSGRKGRLREMLASKRARRSEHPADRPPPHTNFRNPAHLVNPVKKNPNRGPWPRTFRSLISY